MKTDSVRLKSAPLTIAAVIIIFAGVMYAESIINPLLMAFFISIICAHPIAWLRKKKVPDGLAVFIIILLILAIYTGLIQLVGSSLSLFLSDAPK